MSFAVKNKIFAGVFFALSVFVIFILSGVVDVGHDFIGPFPAVVVLALGVCFSFFVIMLMAYLLFIKDWAEEHDGSAEDRL